METKGKQPSPPAPEQEDEFSVENVRDLIRREKESGKRRGFNRGLEPKKILGATDVGGEVLLLMQWKGSDEVDLVSAKTANLKCPQLVIRFYEKRLIWHSSGTKLKDQVEGDKKSSKKPIEKAKDPFKKSGKPREPKNIVGATDRGGELSFLIEWKGSGGADVVPAKIANLKCPQMVIQFYEERLIWQSSGDQDEGEEGDDEREDD